MSFSAHQEAKAVLRALKERDPGLYKLVNDSLPLPAVYKGSGEIKLIVLGQDPTINNPSKVSSITTVLNLNKHGSLRNYLKQLCNRLGLDLDKQVYATNYFKNFFVAPPLQLAKLTEFDLFAAFGEVWLPLLREELAQYPNVPIVTLGQPILQLLAQPPASRLVRDYWGYGPSWKTGVTGDFKALAQAENALNRLVFPFPHITSAHTKHFYSKRLEGYTLYLGEVVGRLA